MNTTPRPQGPQNPNPNQFPQQRPPFYGPPRQPFPNPRPNPQQQPYPNGAHYNTIAGPRPAYPFTPAAPSTPWWEKDGVVAKLFAGAGVLVTLIGVVMLLVIAARAGLLRPEIRVGGGALLSGVLLAASARLHSRLGGRIGSIALAATGTAGLYLCVLAATNFYAWIPAVAGLVLAALIAAGSVALAMKWDSQALAVLMTGSVGALAAALTGGVNLTLVAFLVLLQAAGCVPEFTKDWPAIAAARTIPVAIAASVAVALDPHTASAQIAAYLVATIALASALPAAHRPTEWATAVVYAFGSIPMVIAVNALEGPYAAVAGAAITSMTVSALVIARPVGVGTTTAAAVVTTVSLVSAAAHITAGPWLPSILLAVSLTLGASCYQVKNHFVAGLAVGFAGLGGLATLNMLGDDPAQYPAQSFVAGLLGGLVVVVLLIVAVRRYGFDTDGAVALGAIGLVTTNVVMMLGLGALISAEDGRQIGHLGLTVSWILMSAAVLAMSLRTTKPAAVLATGVVLAGLAVAKLFVHDLAGLDGIARAGAFIVVGLVLLAAGSGYARAFEQRKQVAQAGRAAV